MAKLYTDISDEHEKKFKVIRGAIHADNNGQTLEYLIDQEYRAVVRNLKSNPS